MLTFGNKTPWQVCLVQKDFLGFKQFTLACLKLRCRKTAGDSLALWCNGSLSVAAPASITTAMVITSDVGVGLPQGCILTPMMWGPLHHHFHSFSLFSSYCFYYRVVPVILQCRTTHNSSVDCKTFDYFYHLHLSTKFQSTGNTCWFFTWSFHYSNSCILA